MKILTKKPKDLREGQTIFVFLHWLKTHQKFLPNQSFRMADPFAIPDEELQKLYKEFLKQLKKRKK